VGFKRGFSGDLFSERGVRFLNIQNVLNEGVRFHQEGKIHEAIKCYLKALPKQQGNAQLLYLVGRAYVQIGELNTGIGYLKKALARNPKHLDAHHDLDFFESSGRGVGKL
jgi:tetratricopeptide (TPR) repeat protein